jgi:hypothetical protein
MPRGTTITIPDEVDVALRAEAYRVGCRPGEILVRWLRETFPDYVRNQLRNDLEHRSIVDVLATETHVSPNAEMPPALTEGTPNPKSPQPQVTPTLAPTAPSDLHPEDAFGAEV